MNLLTATIIFILGTTIGSFLSVVIYRLQANKKGIILSRSICPACKTPIKWQHLIPIFSWIFLRGKCAYCDKKIASFYPFLELLTGAIFLFSFLNWNFLEGIESIMNGEFPNYNINLETFKILLFYLVEVSFLMLIFFYDLLHKEILDKISIPAMAIAIVGGLALGLQSPLNMLIGAASFFTFFLLQFLISRGTWIGGGDLRLGILLGLLLGWQMGLTALIIAYIIGSIFSLYLLISRKANRKTMLPFGPFVVSGIIITLFYGEEILDWYLGTLIF